MSPLTKIAIIALGCTALSACNPSNVIAAIAGAAVNADEPAVISDEAVTIVQELQEPIVAPTLQALLAADAEARLNGTMSGVKMNYSASESTDGGQQGTSVVVRIDADGTVEMDLTAFGRTVTFDGSSDNSVPDAYYKNSAGAVRYLQSYDGDWTDVWNGEGKFKSMVRFGASENGSEYQRQHGVIGNKTTATGLPTTGTATYSEPDGLRGDIVATDQPIARQDLYGDVTLNMDFANSQISGSFSNLRYDNADGASDSSSLVLQPTTVTDGDFVGTLTLEDATGGKTLTASAVNGAFYGANAEEVGGNLSFSETVGGTNFVAAGAFGAAKQ